MWKYITVAKTSTTELLSVNGEWYYRSKKISLEKTKYDPQLKYNFVIRYLVGESPTGLVSKIWSSNFAKSRKKHIGALRNELVVKGKIPKNAKRVPKRKIKYENLNNEELIEIIRIYDKYIEIINDVIRKKKFTIISQIKRDIFSILRLCELFGVSKFGYFKWKKLEPLERDK